MNFTHLRIVFCISLFFAGSTMGAMERQPKKLKSLIQEDNYRQLGDALAFAVFGHDFEKVQSLLCQGAPPNYRTNGWQTTLIFAIQRFNDEPKMLKMLIAAGADVNYCTNALGDSPLGYAAYFIKPIMAAILIKAGANLYHANNNGMTILMDVADGARPECMDKAFALGELIVEKMLSIPSEEQKRRVYRFMNCIKRKYPMNYSNFRHVLKDALRAMIKEENKPRVRKEVKNIVDDEDEIRQHLLNKYFRK